MGACISGGDKESVDGTKLTRSQSQGASIGKATGTARASGSSPQRLASDATAEQIRLALAKLAPEEADAAADAWARPEDARPAQQQGAAPTAPGVPLPSVASSLCAAGAMRRRRQQQAGRYCPARSD